MDNIVYILGAGFSAPLGVPTMNDFIIKAKRMVRDDPSSFGHFREIHDLMDGVSNVASYFAFQPHNIEEALSILEMQEGLRSDSMRQKLNEYICSVITHFTPRLIPVEQKGLTMSNWHEHVFGRQNLAKEYCSFLGCLFGLEFYEEAYDLNGQIQRDIKVRKTNAAQVRYDIITLNYDLILENFIDNISASFAPDPALSIGFSTSHSSAVATVPHLIKIHGSVLSGKIIPPTLNKGLHQAQVPIEWEEAHNLLGQAHKIRIIGYSLPQTDSYIKYLLKSAIHTTSGLEQIDVLTMDADGSVEKRYKEFIKLSGNRFRFKNADVIGYLKTIMKGAHVSKKEEYGRYVYSKSFNNCEIQHDEFFSIINSPSP